MELNTQEIHSSVSTDIARELICKNVHENIFKKMFWSNLILIHMHERVLLKYDIVHCTKIKETKKLQRF